MTNSRSKDTPQHFTFEHDGKTYEFEKSLSVVQQPGWLRANRRRDELDLAFTILEEVAGPTCLAVIDEMDEEQFKALMERLNKAVTDGLGN